MKGKLSIGALVGIAMAAAFSLSAVAQQQSGSSAGPPMTSAQAIELLQQLKSLRQLLANQQPAEPLETKVPETGYSLGDARAPLTIVEFSDYQCPFCAQFQIETFQELRRDFVETGKVRFVIRDLPLARHSDSLQAAEAARCAGDQGKFWEMRDALVAHYQDLKEASLLVYARQLGLDTARFQQCVESNKFLSEIRQDQADARAAGIAATPSFVVGKSAKGQVDGILLVGAMPYSRFSDQINRELANTNKTAAVTTMPEGRK
jgi:protein-disulfide isomerase